MDTVWTPPNPKFPPPKADEPPLHRAARLGDHAGIRALAAGGADLNTAFNIGLDPGAYPHPATPLMVAAGSGDGATAATVGLLLELGADPAINLGSGSAACFAAAGLGWNYRPGGDADRLRLVLDAGSPLPETSRLARVVSACAEEGDAARLRLLLERGASPNPHWDPAEAQARHQKMMEMMKGYQARQVAGGNPAAAFMDLDSLPSPIGKPAEAPSSFEIPLFQAAQSGSAECVRVLVAAGADPAQLDEMGRTALYYAQSAAAVQELARAGVPRDVAGQFGRDALDETLDGDLDQEPWRREVADALLARGMSLERSSASENTRLYDAAFREQPTAVRYLLARGHRPAPENRGPTALHAIAWHWDHGDERDQAQLDIVRMLLAAGVSPGSRDKDGNTPLHEAVSGDGANVIVLRELAARGGDVNATNDGGFTPLSWLYETHFEYAKLVPVLLELGANPLIANARGKNPIDLALERARGEEPDWRREQWESKGGTPCGWKSPAESGSPELEMVELMMKAAEKFRASS